ncbi:MAG: methyltransferase, TIGR04325 family [Chitinophagaceae bacterium]|nr:methyltransferase, TIGR04325 family [Chitinophagaceae bacterium]
MNWLEKTKLIKHRLLPSRYGWFGDYKNWNDARIQSNGYDEQKILEKVKKATIKVKSGEAEYERDSVLFDKIEYSWPLLTSLMWIAAKKKGSLSVIDFGGSLGSSYFQNKKFLDGLENIRWSIIEQSNFVDIGQQHIQDPVLQFFFSIEECITSLGIPDILLISCTLPYLEQPYEFMKELKRYKIPYLIIDNTPFNFRNQDRLTIQKIHPSIYPASYPCWFLDYDKVKLTIGNEYSILYEYQNELYIYLDGHKVQYQGIMALLK